MEQVTPKSNKRQKKTSLEQLLADQFVKFGKLVNQNTLVTVKTFGATLSQQIDSSNTKFNALYEANVSLKTDLDQLKLRADEENKVLGKRLDVIESKLDRRKNRGRACEIKVPTPPYLVMDSCHFPLSLKYHKEIIELTSAMPDGHNIGTWMLNYLRLCLVCRFAVLYETKVYRKQNTDENWIFLLKHNCHDLSRPIPCTISHKAMYLDHFSVSTSYLATTGKRNLYDTCELNALAKVFSQVVFSCRECFGHKALTNLVFSAYNITTFFTHMRKCHAHDYAQHKYGELTTEALEGIGKRFTALFDIIENKDGKYTLFLGKDDCEISETRLSIPSAAPKAKIRSSASKSKGKKRPDQYIALCSDDPDDALTANSSSKQKKKKRKVINNSPKRGIIKTPNKDMQASCNSPFNQSSSDVGPREVVAAAAVNNNNSDQHNETSGEFCVEPTEPTKKLTSEEPKDISEVPINSIPNRHNNPTSNDCNLTNEDLNDISTTDVVSATNEVNQPESEHDGSGRAELENRVTNELNTIDENNDKSTQVSAATNEVSLTENRQEMHGFNFLNDDDDDDRLIIESEMYEVSVDALGDKMDELFLPSSSSSLQSPVQRQSCSEKKVPKVAEIRQELLDGLDDLDEFIEKTIAETGEKDEGEPNGTKGRRKRKAALHGMTLRFPKISKNLLPKKRTVNE